MGIGFRNIVKDITAQELEQYRTKRREEDYVLVDVRQPQEYEREHIPGATLIPLGQLEQRMGELDPHKEHVFYCHSGQRSHMASAMALASGRLERVRNLAGGMMGWSGASVPEAPHLDVFADIASLDQALLLAMDMEKAAHVFYRSILDAVQTEWVCSLMQELVDMEKAHARMVYGQLKKCRAAAGGEPPQDFDALFDGLPGEILEGGRSVAELKPWVADAANGACMPLAELAMEIELHAFDLYRAMADHAAQGGTGDAPDSEPARKAQSVFLSLAQQEKEHLRLIMDRLDSFAEEPGA